MYKFLLQLYYKVKNWFAMDNCEYDSEAVDLLHKAELFSKQCGYKYVDEDHILYFILRHSKVIEFCALASINLESINTFLLKYIEECSAKKDPASTDPVSYSPNAAQYLVETTAISKEIENCSFTPIAYILAFLKNNTGQGKQLLEAHGLTKTKIYKALPKYRLAKHFLRSEVPQNLPSHQPILEIKDPITEAKNAVKNAQNCLKTTVFGQDHALEDVVSALKLGFLKLNPVEKPVASFLFLGPTGTGKTELAKQLANALNYKLFRYDMSEYAYGHMVAKLIGSPFGYYNSEQGGCLTKAVSEHPRCVVLLDEIEKAHHDIHNLLLQILDYGMLSDGRGNESNFKNAIIIMTSNLGVKELETNSIGFLDSKSIKDSMKAVDTFFSPEFRNRIDKIITFNYLSKEALVNIVKKHINLVEETLKPYKLTLKLDDKSIKYLVDNGYNPLMGARPLQRIIQKEVILKIADLILDDQKEKELTLTCTKNKLSLS